MKRYIIFHLFIISIFLAKPVSAKNYKYLVPGVWKTELTTGAKVYMAFLRSGRMRIVIKYSYGKTKSISRTYSVVGDKIYVKVNYSTLMYTFTIEKLEKNVMILRNQTGKRFLYKRVIINIRRGERHKIRNK